MIRNIEPISMVRLGYIGKRLVRLGLYRLGPAVLEPPVAVMPKEDVVGEMELLKFFFMFKIYG